MADISKIKLPDGTTYSVKDDTKLPLTGGTMTGNLTLQNCNLYLADGSGNIKALLWIGGNNDGVLSMYNSSGTATINLEPELGRVSCLKMNNQNISDEFTISKTSGNWSVKEITAYRSGNMVQLTIAFKGNGTAVSAGSNAFVGRVTDGEFPVGLVRLIGNGGSSIVMGYVQPTGEIEIKVLVANYTLSASGTFSVMGTYICKDI